MNFYEVNSIQSEFLKLWSQDISINTIPLNSFITYFSDNYRSLIHTFFCGSIHIIILLENVTFDDYYLFVIFFSFYDVNHILTIFFSMCQIHSKVCVTFTQIHTFFRVIGLNYDEYPKIIDTLTTAGAVTEEYNI